MNIGANRPFFALLALLVASVVPASAQVATLDEGTFVIEQNGNRVGVESFTVRSSGFGVNRRVYAQSTLETEARPSRSTTRVALLTEGSSMTIRVYELSVSGAETLQLKLEAVGNRFRAELRNGPNIREREFRGPSPEQPVILLDRLLPHQYYFLGRLAMSRTSEVSVIVPRELEQSLGSLEIVGTEALTVGGQSMQAQHLRLTLAGSVHEVWIDVQNRVLRVEIPDQNLRAVRRAPPSS